MESASPDRVGWSAQPTVPARPCSGAGSGDGSAGRGNFRTADRLGGGCRCTPMVSPSQRRCAVGSAIRARSLGRGNLSTGAPLSCGARRPIRSPCDPVDSKRPDAMARSVPRCPKRPFPSRFLAATRHGHSPLAGSTSVRTHSPEPAAAVHVESCLASAPAPGFLLEPDWGVGGTHATSRRNEVSPPSDRAPLVEAAHAERARPTPPRER